MDVLNILAKITTGVLMILFLYQTLIGVFCLFPLRRKERVKRLRRFAVLTFARNEEQVIGNLIESLWAQDYPRDLFDVYVIADNCTDRTADVARELGCRVYERQNRTLVGKGYAMNWFFRKLLAESAETAKKLNPALIRGESTGWENVYIGEGNETPYDAFVVFDADNLAAPGFLAAANASLESGDSAVVGYRDSKNPTDSWVSGMASVGFWYNNRFYNQARQRAGLSALISGTGFAFRADLVADGWNTETICEDFEFSVRTIANGGRIGFNRDAVFYDEQPTELMVSLRQRLRWAAGHYQNLWVGLKPLLRALPRERTGSVLDYIVYMLLMPLCTVQLLVTLFQFILTLAAVPRVHWLGMTGDLMLPLVISTGAIIAQAFLALLLERRLSLKLIKGALAFPVYVFSNAVLFMLALVRPNVGWHPIEHKRAVGLSQIDRG